MPDTSLWDLLTNAASERSQLHCLERDDYRAASWAQVAGEAEHMTLGLRRAGVEPGTRVASVLTNGPAVPRGILATWLSGGALASLPVPARGMDAEEYERQLRGICDVLEPELFVLEERVASLLPEGLREKLRLITWESVAGSGRAPLCPPEEDELAFIQYSSGSTSEPKGCMLTPRAIAAQTQMVAAMIEARGGEDIGASWLPLSHDMGLFGCLLSSWANDLSLYLAPPERFIFSPQSWFGDMAEVGATLTAATNTALYIGARAHSSKPLTRELRLRVLILGAERVQAETLAFALQSLAPYGLRREALMPAYGLAEATLAVSATPVQEPPRALTFDALALADGELVPAPPDDPAVTCIVGAGRPCAGVELAAPAGERLGEIAARSPALSAGYLGEPERSAERFRDGAILTGDIGFVRDGHLYPVGRLDDMVSVGGRNVYAREVESALDSLAGIRRGCATVVEHADGPRSRLMLCAELQGPVEDYRALARAAANVAMAKAAVSLDECVFLERDRLPKTPSGKIQRHRTRALLAEERLEALARVRLGSA
jgi:fatty-acyl-CoA synthase